MKKKETYSFADPVFYESPHLANSEGHLFGVALLDAPEGWERLHRDLWITMVSPAPPLPSQGWKIHVSACPGNAEKVLETVWRYAVSRGLTFKFLPDRFSFFALNGKGASRESGGKTATLYPADDRELQRALEELSLLLDGEPGPYILSDARWAGGPLYVRYGGFTAGTCLTEDGELRLAIENQDGVLVPDRREPSFELPSWVRPPGFLAPHLAARRGTGELDRLPYRVLRALHFSNGGGVYLAVRRSDGRRVVLKEARPLAGLDRNGDDAVTRMDREADALKRLAGISGVPELYDRFIAGEHHFLAVEHRPGRPLTTWVELRNPLMSCPVREEVLRYREEGLALLGRIERLLDAVHARGLIYGDLHPNNILVAADGTVSMVDFELAADLTDDSYRPALRFPGFAPTSGKTGVAVDRHALAMLRYWVFLPLHQVLELAPDKVGDYVMEVERRFDLPGGYGRGVLRELGAGTPARPRATLAQPLEVNLGGDDPDLKAIRTSMIEAIGTSATPDRADRLFPGSFEQFVSGGAGFAYGAAGTLWALSVAGAARSPGHEEWLLRTARRTPGRRPGFYDGLHGVAYVLDHLGHRDAALDVVERAVPLSRSLRAGNLFNGLAGVGLGLLHFARRTEDPALRDELAEVTGRLAEAVTRGRLNGPHGRAGAGGTPHGTGLLRGWSGVALYFLRLYEAGGDRAHLDLAGLALHHDLDRCRPRVGENPHVNAGDRGRCDLERGSAGIALVADEFLAHRADDRVHASLPALIQAARPEHTAEASLFEGRAGLVAALAVLRPEGAERSLAGQLRHLARHAVAFHGHLAFPRYYRLSMDLAHGTAGALLAVSAVIDRNAAFLPFLGERREDERPPYAAASPSTSPISPPASMAHTEQEADTRGMSILDLQRLPASR